MEYTTIQYTRLNTIGIITLNRPQALNAMDLVMRAELKDLFTKLKTDADTKVIIIKGNGRAFCAGGDINTMGTFKPNKGRARLQNVHPLFKAIQEIDKPVIAAIQGPAAGNGFALACACDFRICADNSKFVTAFINLGLVPDCGTMYTLPRLVGLTKAKELCMLSDKISAQEALAIGLVNKVVPLNELEKATLAFAERLAEHSELALGLMKNILNQTYDLPLTQLLDEEALAQDICMSTDLHKEAVAHFLNKNKK